MQIEPFQQPLLDWYFANQRDLPWRQNQDPYRIWISEIMLQQTQVTTVIDYYNRFTAAFPNVQALAAASEDEVFKLWEGLGYYSRARNLMKCAKVLVENYNGIFPNQLSQALKLPGIGPYTAGAVLSIAYNLPVPAVDGNVLRVYSRLYESYEDIGNPKTRLTIEALVQDTLPEDRRHFNQAIMELGATVCTPKQPKCDVCPVQTSCLAYHRGVVDRLPVKLQKLKRTEHTVPVAYLTCEEEILLVKRSGEGLLSGLWGFPFIELGKGSTAEEQHVALMDWFAEYLGIEPSLVSENPLAEVKHVFSHKTWHMSLWHFRTTAKITVPYPESTWVTRAQIKDFALSTAYVKLLKK